MTEPTKTSRFPTWLKVVLGVIFLPVAIVWLVVVMWKRGKFSVAARVGLTAAAIVALFVLSAIGAGIVDPAPAPTATAAKPVAEKPAAASEQQQPEPSKKPEPTWESGPVTEQTVQAALGGAFSGDQKLKSIEVLEDFGTDATGDYIVTVSYLPGSFWDESDLVHDTAVTSVGVFQKLFANPKVSRVNVESLTDFTDQYGKKAEEVAVRIKWNKATAKKVDWSGFRDMVDLDFSRVFTIAEGQTIHPAIYKNMKPEDQEALAK